MSTTITKEEFQLLCDASSSKKEILMKLGYTKREYESGWHYRKIDSYIKFFNIDLFKFNENVKIRKSKLKSALLNDVLIEKSTYNSSTFKGRLIVEKLLINKCYECGQLDKHNGKSLVLQLDHINGNRYDNRIENLRMLCPNCHSQTPTYGGKNKKNAEKGIYKKRKRKRKNLINWYETQEMPKISLIENSNIDFSKFGWVSKVAPIINKSHQKVTIWMKRFMPEFYETKCFKKKKVERTMGHDPTTLSLVNSCSAN